MSEREYLYNPIHNPKKLYKKNFYISQKMCIFAVMKYIQLNSDKVFFSSDWHLDHVAIAGPGKWTNGHRDFSSVNEMNEYLIHKINTTVPVDGILFFLGDLAFRRKGATSEQHAAKWRYRVNCRTVHWILGNHDYCTKHSDFAFVGHYLEMNINGKQIIMSHYPMLSWHWVHKGSWNLHGHCHADKSIQKANKACKRLDVGVDSYKEFYGDYGIFTFQQCVEIMESK